MSYFYECRVTGSVLTMISRLFRADDDVLRLDRAAVWKLFSISRSMVVAAMLSVLTLSLAERTTATAGTYTSTVQLYKHYQPPNHVYT